MKSPQLVIGLIGEQWSGKDTFAKLIQEMALPKKVEIISFSAILTEILNNWSIPSQPRENRRKLAEFMKKAFDKYGNALANIIRQRISNSSSDIVILISLKWYDDVEMVKQFPKNIIVYITATLDNRYRRRQKAKKEQIDYEGESYYRFVLEENDPGDLLVTQIGREQADVKIDNNGTMEEFVEQVKKIYNEKIAPLT